MSQPDKRPSKDAEARFRALAARGSIKDGLAVLDQLDRTLAEKASRKRSRRKKA